MSNWSLEEQQEAVQKIQERAVVDADFRQRTLADPASVVHEVSGKTLPDGFTLRAVSNDNADLTLVLPDPEAEMEELSDTDLEQVAGGRCASSCCGSAPCAVTSTLYALGVPGIVCA